MSTASTRARKCSPRATRRKWRKFGCWNYPCCAFRPMMFSLMYHTSIINSPTILYNTVCMYNIYYVYVANINHQISNANTPPNPNPNLILNLIPSFFFGSRRKLNLIKFKRKREGGKFYVLILLYCCCVFMLCFVEGEKGRKGGTDRKGEEGGELLQLTFFFSFFL